MSQKKGGSFGTFFLKQNLPIYMYQMSTENTGQKEREKNNALAG